MSLWYGSSCARWSHARKSMTESARFKGLRPPPTSRTRSSGLMCMGTCSNVPRSIFIVPLSHFVRAGLGYQRIGQLQRLEGPRIGPPPVQDIPREQTAREIGIVHVGDLQF